MNTISDRIFTIMQSENLSQSEFADRLNIQRSTLSHLFSGRNKPSLDLIEKILHAFPQISTDWLILGKGNKTDLPKKQTSLLLESETLEQKSANSNVMKMGNSEQNTEKNILIDSQQSLQKVILFYSNGEFEVFNEKK